MKTLTEYINEGKLAVTAKDWQRAIDMYKNGDNAIFNQADRIKDANKAAQRYVAGLKLMDINPEEQWKESKWVKDGYEFTGKFGYMGNRAIRLGMTYDQIIELYNNTPEPPEDLYAEAHRIKFGINDNTFTSSVSRALKKLGIKLIDSKSGHCAKTDLGIRTMERNGRKWTEWYDITVEKDGKTLNIGFDCISDEGGGSTTYALPNDWRFTKSGTELAQHIDELLKNKFEGEEKQVSNVKEAREIPYEEALKNAEATRKGIIKNASSDVKRKFGEVMYIEDGTIGEQCFAFAYHGKRDTMMLTMDSTGEPMLVLNVSNKPLTSIDDKPIDVYECAEFQRLIKFIDDLKGGVLPYQVFSIGDGSFDKLFTELWEEYIDYFRGGDEWLGTPFDEEEVEEDFRKLIDEVDKYKIKVVDPSTYYTMEV